MDLSKVGKNIKDYRTQMGYSQIELAELANVSTVHISHIETGSGKMSLDCLVAISDVLKTTPDHLLLGMYKTPLEKAAQLMADRIEGLTQDEIDYVFETISLLKQHRINRK